ncbi:MAG: galactose oxidase [Woeseiaceae bacterium]|nr:galactose oxidase [Woeseiaceae bacterium]
MRTLIALAAAMTAVTGESCSLDDLDLEAGWEIEPFELPRLPHPVSNNAVTAVIADGNEYLISFNGLGPGRTHADVHARTFVFNGDEWREAEPVPGGVGRLASVAVSLGEEAWVFGGYTVAEDGSEVSTPWTHSFDPVSGEFEVHAPMPVPVDDAVAVVYEDRYVYLISGWHDYGNVNLVQRYDAQTDSWTQATPTPGPAVFGHAGGIAGNRIVYCDGVVVAPQILERRQFEATDQCLLGIIDADNPRRIDWQRIPPHPGPARYRMAATGIAIDGDSGVWFLGGSDNPYNYDGIGYNGEPSQPVPGAFVWDFESNEWFEFATVSEPTMDHRGLVIYREAFVTVGGMHSDQEVIDAVYAYGDDDE